MILLGYDLETTGLDKTQDRVTEVGLVLYSTVAKRVLESAGFLVKTDGVPIPPEITEKTGITIGATERFGHEQEDALDTIISFAQDADAIATHNGRRFDMPFTQNWAARIKMPIPDKLLIDTMTDLPGAQGEQLITMCAKHGFLPDSTHDGLTDAKSVIRLTSYYDINKIIERAKSPMVVLQSRQDNSQEANKAVRKLKFRWHGIYRIWWRVVKEMDVDEIVKQAPFEVVRASKEILPEYLEES